MRKKSTSKNQSLIVQWAGVFIFSLIISPLFSQTSHHVEVKSNVFVPADITINTGDAIIWTNTGGFHNVNGTFASYPDNPDHFGNETGAAGWTYQYVFLFEGEYQYHCDPHLNFGMTGTITVNGPTSSVFENAEQISLYPNPAGNVLRITNPGADFSLLSIKIYSVTGALKYSEGFTGQKSAEINLEKFDPGIYMIKIESESGLINRRFIKE